VKFSETDLDVLAKTVYGEARGELLRFGLAPLIGIANVILNRKKKNFAKTIAEVCLAPHQFSCWNPGDPNLEKIRNVNRECFVFKTCLEASRHVLDERWPDLTDGCDHYHERTVKPYWAACREPKRILGSHHFYELRRIK
jgi:spore germination cell wall hydrolase CwlJ-like protein